MGMGYAMGYAMTQAKRCYALSPRERRSSSGPTLGCFHPHLPSGRIVARRMRVPAWAGRRPRTRVPSFEGRRPANQSSLVRGSSPARLSCSRRRCACHLAHHSLHVLAAHTPTSLGVGAVLSPALPAHDCSHVRRWSTSRSSPHTTRTHYPGIEMGTMMRRFELTKYRYASPGRIRTRCLGMGVPSGSPGIASS